MTVIIHTNHDSVRMTTIKLRSNVASSEIVCEASLRNYIDRPSSKQLRACSDVLSYALSGEGHISHCNRVLRLCHPEQSSCFCEVGCRSFVKLALRSLFTICHVKKLACLCEPQFGWISQNISPPHSVLETKKLQANYLSLWTIAAECELWWFLNFDGLTFLTALVLYSQSDYLNHSNRDSDWLIVACFMRV